MGFSVTAFLFGFAVALHCGSRVLADRADCEKAKRNLPPPANNQALLCKAHPANNKPNKPVLVASWTQISKIEQIQETYLARYKQHKYEPVDSAENKNKYSGLDLFYTAKLKDIKYRIFFQRSALVYLFLDTEVDTLTDALRRRAPSLAGWKREGWAMLATNNRNIKYGVYEKAEQQLDKFVYVLSKRTNKKFFVDVPEIKKVARSNIPLSETANLWIAEGDGSPSPVIKFNGSDITNKKCPGALHNMWKVREGGKEYLTWHPMWDPCWWCAYGHEHGSSPKQLFGYQPKFNLPAKTQPTDGETNEGVKGFAFSYNGQYDVYFYLHAQLSKMTRVNNRFHSINFVVFHKKSRRMEMNIHYKADFGYNAVRPKVNAKNAFIPVNARETAIKNMLPAGGKRNFRSINIIDRRPQVLRELMKKFNIRKESQGNYEEWRTVPICTNPKKDGDSGVRTVLKYPGLAAKSVALRSSQSTQLHLMIKGVLYRSVNLERIILASELEIAEKHCPDGGTGEFFTDKWGKKLDGDGPRAIKQFIRKGFSLTLDGRWEPIDPWQGIYGEGDGVGCGKGDGSGDRNSENFLDQGFFVNLGYGVDPDSN